MSLDPDPSIVRVPQNQLTTNADMLECVTSLWKKHECTSIIFDTATTMYRLQVEEYVKKSAKHDIPTLAEYGPAAERTRMILRFALKIPDIHVIIMCHRLAEKDEVLGRIIGGPNMPGKLVADAPGMVDEMYYLLKVHDSQIKKFIPKICTDGDGIWPAKTRLGAMGLFERYEEANLEHMIAKAIKARCRPQEVSP